MKFEEIFEKKETKPIVNFNNKDLFLIESEYINHRPYFGLVDKNLDLFADITINLPECYQDEDEIFLNGDLKTELKNKLFKTKVFNSKGSKVRYNLGTYERAFINKKLLKDYEYKQFCIKYWETENDRDQGYASEMVTFGDFEEVLKEARESFEDNNWDSMEISDSNNNLYFFKDNQSEEFYINDLRITKVSHELLTKYVDNWVDKKELPIKEELIYCEDKNKYIAVDNTSSDCFVEEFDNEKDTLKYLSNEYEKENEL